MRISAIQGQIGYQKPELKKINKADKPKTTIEPAPILAPAFKGRGNGMLIGLGVGLIGGLLLFAGGATIGAVTLPTILGGAGVVGSGAAGAYLGDKIEDKISGEDKK